ncbi:MAG TPA: glycosyltransferase family 2 protein, partial [Vicinamibacterales bacterium]|nr:glycosyltransferase family 2 protein [Vicinamibacterales bacterium]
MTKTLSVIVPAYNEERYAGRLLERIAAVDLSPVGLSREIIFVDDGSDDRTAEIAAAMAGVRLIRMPHAGKGRAVRAGIAAAIGDYVIIHDA